MKYFITVFSIFILCMSGGHLFAFGNMSTEELRTLFTVNTAWDNHKEGARPGSGPTNALENHAEVFVIFFSKKGIAKYKVGDEQKKKKSHVTDSGNLCLEWKDEKEDCAPVYREGKVYKRAKKMGRVMREFEFIRLTAGNGYGL